MRTKVMLITVALAAAAAAHAQPPPASPSAAPAQVQAPPQAPQQARAAPEAPPETKSMSGMAILGNQEAPKSLVIVPWKSSEIGLGLGVSRALDTRVRAVDKDVFMRELKYYGIRSGTAK
jgi:hypothetical protein